MNSTAFISPSYKRAKGLKTHLLLPSVVYCVGESEAEEYQQQGVNVMVCPDRVNGNIARARNWILDQYAEQNVLLIDDDIAKIGLWESVGARCKSKALEIDEIEEFIELGFLMCAEFGARMWGINAVSDKGAYKEYIPFACKSYISGSLSGFIKPELRYDESMPLKEDYDMTIQQCNRYRKVLRFNMVHMIKNDHGNLGGCAKYRTMQREKEQFALLQKKWGANIVRKDNGKRMVHRQKKTQYDINPVIKIPIGGI
jgi:glycosyltransferase involved in cell wall biosynthesis